jgi:hypothetical protein
MGLFSLAVHSESLGRMKKPWGMVEYPRASFRGVWELICALWANQPFAVCRVKLLPA